MSTWPPKSVLNSEMDEGMPSTDSALMPKGARPCCAQGEKTHRVAVIMSNPEQSKHLETARLKINDVWVDLVNLRSEEYAHHSRIPTMEVSSTRSNSGIHFYETCHLLNIFDKALVELGAWLA